MKKEDIGGLITDLFCELCNFETSHDVLEGDASNTLVSICNNCGVEIETICYEE